MAVDGATAKAIAGSVWLNQGKFEVAEAMAQETIAKEHSGLKIEGTSVKKSGASNVASVIGEARSMIEQSLKSNPSKPHTSYADLERRVAALEKENNDLKTRMSALEKIVKSGERGITAESVACDTKPDDDDDDDFDLFGDDDEQVAEAAEKLKNERVAAYQEKKNKKPAIIAKSSIVLDVKPWDDETDMNEIEKCVRSIQTDGLIWKASQLVPVGYGIKKLRINCIVEDDKVGTDFLEEEITKFEDLVQSMDVASFNKL